MVGEEGIMNFSLKKKILEVSKSFLGAPYKLGGQSPEEGFHCASYIYCFYRDIGADIADHEGDLNLKNYAEAWAQKPEQTKAALLRFMLGIGEKVNPKFLWPGDLALIKSEEKLTSAIYLGNGNFLTLDVRVGIMIFPRRSILGEIVEARRPCHRL